MGISLAALGGLPPSPLFVSEVLILLGGLTAGETAVVAIAAVALALGFLGLVHALLEGVVGEPGRHARVRRSRSERPIAALSVVLGAGLLALTVAGVLLPDSAFVRHSPRGAVSCEQVAPEGWRDAIAARIAPARASRGRGRRARGARVPGAPRSRRAAAKRRRSAAARPTAACRRSSTCCRPPTGTSARRTIYTGSTFAGHQPLRALVAHVADPAAWTIPVAGNDPACTRSRSARSTPA